MPTSPTPADRPADQLRAAAEKLRAAAAAATPGPWKMTGVGDFGWSVSAPGVETPDTEQGRTDAELIALMHPGVGLALADSLESTARTVDAVSEKYEPDPAAHWLAPALAVARQLLGTTECTCGTPGVGNYEGPQEDCPQHGVRPPYAELTADEARDQAADLATQLYKAQDALAFVGECCDIADREQRPVTTGDVRKWLKGARCGHQPTAAAPPAPADRAAVLREGADELGRMDYDVDASDYGYDSYRDAWNSGVMDGAGLLRRLADDAAAGVQQTTTTADRAAALGMTPTEYRQHSHNTAVEQVRAAARGLFAGTAIRVWDALEEPPTPTEADTLAPWLYQRFMNGGVGWDRLDEDDRSYWEHHARAVRRAVARGGFKTPTAPPAAPAVPEERP